MSLSFAAYLLGAIELGAIVVALAYGAEGLRRWALPGWRGAAGKLGEAVIGIALVIWVAEILGAVGALDEWPLVLGCVAVGLAGGLVGRRLAGRQRGGPRPPSPSPGRAAWIVAGVAIALLFAQWAGRSQLSLDRGMYGFDTTWYHMPFAARFVQSGSIGHLLFTSPAFLSWFYPANSELVHSVGILATSRDIVSPIVNLGWLAFALLAAWCIGRPFGAGPASMIGAAVVLGGGVFGDQPGEARNDIVGTALLLASAALLINGCLARVAEEIDAPPEPDDAQELGWRMRLSAGPLALAGIAAGLALGTKLTLLSPVAALTVAVIVAAPVGRRGWSAVIWLGTLLAGCGYWFARNLFETGNPMPWITKLGPLSLPGPHEVLPSGRKPLTVAHYATETSVWRHWFFPALSNQFGALWPLLLALVAVAAIVAIVAGRPVALRVLGFVTIAAAIAYPFTPLTASGAEGSPVGFSSNLRYLAPVVALGLALLPAALARWGERWRWGTLGVLTVAFAFALVRSDAWDSAPIRAAAAAGVGVGILLWAGNAIRDARERSAAFGHAFRWRIALRFGIAIVLLSALVGGYFEQRHYLDNRYATPSGAIAEPGQDAAFAWARGVHDQRIGTVTIRQYPLYGTDLTNRVQFVGTRGSDDSFRRIRRCGVWRHALNTGRYDYVVTGLNFPTPKGPRQPPEERWTASDPAAKRVVHDRTVSVFRLRGRLDRNGCGKPSPGGSGRAARSGRKT